MSFYLNFVDDGSLYLFLKWLGQTNLDWQGLKNVDSRVIINKVLDTMGK